MEIQSDAIHAIAQTSRFGAVVENMPEVAPAAPAVYLRALLDP